MYSIGVGEGVSKTLFSFHKKNLRLDPDPIGSGFSNSLEPDSAKCLDPDSVQSGPETLIPGMRLYTVFLGRRH
jgi:hypothetical protein